MKKIAITGANGFVGQHLCEYFKNTNWQVVPLSRAASYGLTDEPPVPLLKGCDVLIHCAHTRQAVNEIAAREVNLKGTQKLINASSGAGVKHIVYISSMSSHKDAISDYGQTKFAIESAIDQTQHLIVRPGLVLGNGGLFKQIRDYISSHKFVPLVNGGVQPVQTILINELVKAIGELIERKAVGIYCVAERPGPTLNNLYSEIAKYRNKKIVFINVPAYLVQAAIRCLKPFKAKLPVDEENLKGLMQLRSAPTDDVAQIISFQISDYKKSIAFLES